jgi:hypothetical protein
MGEIARINTCHANFKAALGADVDTLIRLHKKDLLQLGAMVTGCQLLDAPQLYLWLQI